MKSLEELRFQYTVFARYVDMHSYDDYVLEGLLCEALELLEAIARTPNLSSQSPSISLLLETGRLEESLDSAML